MEVPNRVPWVNIAIGILTIVSPYVLGVTSSAVMTSTWIAGAVIAIVAIIELAVNAQHSSARYWPVINILAGIWLLISTSLSPGMTGLIWSDIILGVAAIVTAATALSYESLRGRQTLPHA